MEKQWVVYILRCADDTLYTGITNDLQHRLDAHNAGNGAKYTRSRGPVALAYHEEVPDKNHALRRELEIKKMSRHDKLRLIEENHITGQYNFECHSI